uniref:J domain-containing protein n=1 Tax=Ditylenchus dipsaci TaxID=166011 RepID=A0A915CP78_9BILA
MRGLGKRRSLISDLFSQVNDLHERTALKQQLDAALDDLDWRTGDVKSLLEKMTEIKNTQPHEHHHGHGQNTQNSGHTHHSHHHSHKSNPVTKSKSCRANSAEVDFTGCSAYETLGVKPGATQTEIKRGYKVMALKMHPDRNRNDPEKYTKLMQQVSEAYDKLKQ